VHNYNLGGFNHGTNSPVVIPGGSRTVLPLARGVLPGTSFTVTLNSAQVVYIASNNPGDTFDHSWPDVRFLMVSLDGVLGLSDGFEMKAGVTNELGTVSTMLLADVPGLSPDLVLHPNRSSRRYYQVVYNGNFQPVDGKTLFSTASYDTNNPPCFVFEAGGGGTLENLIFTVLLAIKLTGTQLVIGLS
jgi:hypothetical protein